MYDVGAPGLSVRPHGADRLTVQLPFPIRVTGGALAATTLDAAVLTGLFARWLEVASGAAFGVAVLTALLVRVSILAHELGHAFAARSRGANVEEVRLHALGGVTVVTLDQRAAGLTVRWIAAGPLATAGVLVAVQLLSAVCLGAAPGLTGLDEFVRTRDAAHAVVVVLFILNTGVLAMNLLPVVPLDGGRLLVAAVARVTGDALRAHAAGATAATGPAWCSSRSGSGTSSTPPTRRCRRR